ncbi:MAG: hypothetical protein Q8O43_06555 [Dehalococcoidia bacterium]|nr:hypothetical protein [Dehalococcoidia bacterium]
MIRGTLKTIFSPWGKVLLAFITAGMSLLILLPEGTQSSIPTVDLNVLGYGSVPWEIKGIKPGDSGTRGITLRNAGSQTGKVTIWLSNVENREGDNPEAETGNKNEPGELGRYLTLKLGGDGIRPGISMPVPVNDFPKNSNAYGVITIDELKSGGEVDLFWEWNLPPSTGNEVQGDKLTFDINYLIEEVEPKPAPQPEAPKPTPAPVRSIQIIVPGVKAVERIIVEGKTIAKDISVTSTQKPITISFE